MPTWPNTLPVSPLLDGFSETLPETLIRTKMETGPDKVGTTRGARVGTRFHEKAGLVEEAPYECRGAKISNELYV